MLRKRDKRQKYIEKIYRKVAMRIAKMSPEEIAETDFTIREEDLEQYVGKRIFLSDRLYDETPAGVVMGLAWTSMEELHCILSVRRLNLILWILQSHISSLLV